MPVALVGPIRHRPAVEAEAKRFQRSADRHVPALRRTLLSLLLAGRRSFAPDLIERGVRDSDWTLIREGLAPLHQHVTLVKDDDPGDDPEVDAQLVDTFTAGAEYALRLVPSFDLVDQNAAQYARTRAGTLLTDLDENALANARAAVAFGMENGLTVAQTAKFISQAAYLPERAMNAVENYFHGLIARLEQGDSIAEAARAEGRYRALSPLKFLDATNVDTLVQRYSDRWVDYTAKTTARTLTIEASNAGLRDGWNQAAAAGLFDPVTAVLEWYATDDEITCDQCQDLDGTDVEFQGGSWDGVDFPPAHPNCRCTMVLIMGNEASFPAFDDAEAA